ncbi:SIR2 family NAD-dependent protein deacylase [Actinomycetospora sp. C-140]
MDDDTDVTYDLMARQLQRGRVVPVLGAGVNMCGRPEGTHWQRGQYLPSGPELATYLADEAGYPNDNERDLARVSQYLAAVLGGRSLYEDLRYVFDVDYPPTALHGYLAAASRHVRENPTRHGCMLFLTTNYDDGLECAFRSAREPFDLLVYIAQGPQQGLFRHVRPDGSSTVIESPNVYSEIDFEQRAVIAKIHGAVQRMPGPVDPTADSYVITEDHYVDYISRADPRTLFPARVAEKLVDSHLLFLGYSLRDWNFRVLLYRMWAQQQGLTQKSWAIESKPDVIDLAAWRERGVSILKKRLEAFVEEMARRMPPPETAA